MGLTLYYELSQNDESADAAHDALVKLRKKALALPFEKVSELKTFDAGDVEELQREVAAVKFGGPAVLLGQASCCIQNDELRKVLGEDQFPSVEPERFFQFTVFPGEGSETATFGLSQFPPTTVVEGREWKTGLKRWHWHSFCKTQYASNPKYGGIDHFLKCHLGLIELFDDASELGILERVADDTDYWEHRDEQLLRSSVEDMNRLIASFAGSLKDGLGQQASGVRAPITDFPDFEHLEAEGHGAVDLPEDD